MKEINLLNTLIHSLSTSELLSKITSWIEKDEKNKTIITANVDHLMKLQKDSEFRNVYQSTDLITADGAPLLWAGKFLGTPIEEKISGSDLLPKIFKLAHEKKWKLFFMGGREGAADLALKNLRDQFGDVDVMTDCPPFGFEKDDAINNALIEKVNNFQPNILLVGLGAPKQEKWIHNNKPQLQFNCAIGIGVSFEFEAGMVKRAPKWMQKIGMEWSWRIIQEPKRLWKRYIIDDMPFFWLLLKQKLGK